MSRFENSRWSGGWGALAVILLAAGLLCLGIAEPYRGKHEDNNALFAAFARNHVHLGLGVTRAHDTLYDPASGTVDFYGHHPPGGGLLLAGWSRLVGGLAPWQVRSLAVVASLAALLLFWSLVRRRVGAAAALGATAVLAVLPQISFYGRMVNHEPLALPFLVLLVWVYFEILEEGDDSGARRGWQGWKDWRGWLVFALVAGVAAGIAWLAFFVLAACGVHALIYRPRPGARELRVFAACAAVGVLFFALDVAHIAWASGDVSHLAALLVDRAGAGQDYSVLDWVRKMASFSFRHATIAGTLATGWLAARAARRRGRGEELTPAESLFSIFFLAGVAYLVVFGLNAWKHHYWQLPLAPAAAIAFWEALRGLWQRAPTSRWAMALLVVMCLEALGTSGSTLSKRHTRIEARVVEVAEELERAGAPAPGVNSAAPASDPAAPPGGPAARKPAAPPSSADPR